MGFIFVVLLSVSTVWGNQEASLAQEPIAEAAKETPAVSIESTEKAEEGLEQPEAISPVVAPIDKTLSAPIVFREKSAFNIYFAEPKEKQATFDRATEATQALDKALKAPDSFNKEAKLVETAIRGKVLEVRIRGYKVVDLLERDAKAAGFSSLDDYQEQVRTEFNSFITKELSRLQVQQIALQFFLSVFFAFMGFVIFRQVRQAFNKADLVIEHKRESFKPVVFLSENLVSGQALGGLLAFFLVVGRVLAYLLVILTTLAAILGQFHFSQELLRTFFAQSFSQFLGTVQSIIATIPSLMLGVLLLFIWHLSLQVLNLFLRGVRSERISWAYLSSHRIPIVRFWGTVSLSFIFFPLIIAAFFGRFQTPLETIVLIGAAIAGVGALPLVASIAAGSVILWQQSIEPGQRIQIGERSGLVREVSLFKITLESTSGNLYMVPMLQLMLRPYSVNKSHDQRTFEVKVVRSQPLSVTMQAIQKLFPSESKAQVSCLSMSATEYLFVLRFAATETNVLAILSEAHDQQKIQLSGDLVKEV